MSSFSLIFALIALAGLVLFWRFRKGPPLYRAGSGLGALIAGVLAIGYALLQKKAD